MRNIPGDLSLQVAVFLIIFTNNDKSLINNNDK